MHYAIIGSCKLFAHLFDTPPGRAGPVQRSLIVVNVHSALPDDRTARARIRDEALRLFAERGPDAVTIRDIATAASVSAPLVIRHFGSRDGLRAAVDEHVARLFEALLSEALNGSASPLDPAAAPSLADLVAGGLPAGSPVPGYLGRLLLAGGPVGTDLFRRLYAVSRDALAGMVRAGLASSGADPEVRAAFLLVNDLAVLVLRDRLADVLGVDPLSAAGLRRWSKEVLTIYQAGLGAADPDTDRPARSDPRRSG